jgi:DNA-binding IclR family transcriptional regulator
MDRAANATKSRSPRTERASVAGAQSVLRALSILRQFSPSRSGVTGSELAASFGYSVPTANRLLRVLETERFLVFDRATRRYCPGPEILRLSGMVLDRDGGVAHTLASAERLRDATGETATVFWRFGDERTCIQEVPSRYAHRVTPGLGRRYPLGRGAAGKALLLAQDEQTIRDLLRTPNTEVDVVLAELDTIRARGFAVSAGETIDGAVSVAVPLLGIRRGLVAISVTGPIQRFGVAAAEAVGSLLTEEARRLDATIRY